MRLRNVIPKTPVVLQEFRIEFLAGRGAETHEGIDVHGRSEGINYQADEGPDSGSRDPSEGPISAARHFDGKERYSGLYPKSL